MSTPQMTIRCSPESRAQYQARAEAAGYDSTAGGLSAMIRALLDGAVDGTVDVPPPPKDKRCKFGGPEGCTQPRKTYPWATICGTCGRRDEVS